MHRQSSSDAMDGRSFPASSKKNMPGRDIRRYGKWKQAQAIDNLKAKIQDQEHVIETLQTQCGLLADLLGDRVDQLQRSHLCTDSIPAAGHSSP
eukprot:5751289-Karenia_brevis.AAC.1